MATVHFVILPVREKGSGPRVQRAEQSISQRTVIRERDVWLWFDAFGIPHSAAPILVDLVIGRTTRDLELI